MLKSQPTNKSFYELPWIVTTSSVSKKTITTQAQRLANYLASQQVPLGAKVIVMTNDQHLIFTCAISFYQAGLVLVCIDPTTGPQQLSQMMTQLDPAAVIADNDIHTSNTNIRWPDLVLSSGGPKKRLDWLPSFSKKKNATISVGQVINDRQWSSSKAPTANISDQQAAYITYTSGSSAVPKAVEVSRYALAGHVNTLSKVFKYTENSTLLCFLPAHHTDGLVHGCYVPILTGMVVVRPGAFRLTTNLNNLLNQYQISHFLAVPTILSMIADGYSDQKKLFTDSGVHTIISTAGTLDNNLWERFEQTFGTKVSNFYGLTETVSGALYCHNETYRFGSVGKPINAEARLVKDGVVIEQPDEPGELQLRTDHLMTGYLSNENPSDQSSNGQWFSTGDQFHRDESGYYFFESRLKDIIKRGGVTVHPQEIREALERMDSINDCEVIGIADPVFEQAIVACVVTNQDTQHSLVQSHCSVHLPQDKQPDHIIFLSKLPKNAIGKVEKAKLLYTVESQLQHQSAPEQNTTDNVFEITLEVAAAAFNTTVNHLNNNTNKDQIAGWDSYAHLKFIKQLEKKFSIRLKARDIMQIQNIQQAAICVKQKLELNINA